MSCFCCRRRDYFQEARALQMEGYEAQSRADTQHTQDCFLQALALIEEHQKRLDPNEVRGFLSALHMDCGTLFREKGDEPRAYDHYQKSAQLGNAVAQEILGQMSNPGTAGFPRVPELPSVVPPKPLLPMTRVDEVELEEISFASISNTKDLIEKMNNPETSSREQKALRRLAIGILDLFSKEGVVRKEHLQEIVFLAGAEDRNIVHHVFTVLIQKIKEAPFVQAALIDAIGDALEQADLTQIHSQDLVDGLGIIMEKLGSVHLEKDLGKEAFSVLVAVTALLDRVADSKAFPTERLGKLEAWKTYLTNTVTTAQDQRLQLQGEIAIQALERVSPEETTFATAVRGVQDWGSRICSLYTHIKEMDFSTVSELWSHSKKEHWYDQYRFCQTLVRAEKLDDLARFIRQEGVTDPHVLWGVNRFLAESTRKDPQLRDVPDTCSMLVRLSKEALDVTSLSNELFQQGVRQQESSSIDWVLQTLKAEVIHNQRIRTTLEMYIETFAKSNPQFPGSYPLLPKLKEFISGAKRSLLLLGDSGVGKSTFLDYIQTLFWQEEELIPIHINLPQVEDFEKMVENQLIEKGFTEEHIEHLKQDPSKVIFLLDGYDEMQKVINPFLATDLKTWTESKAIITCRSYYLSRVSKPEQLFNPDIDKQAWQNLDEYYVVGFAKDQIDQYIQRHIEKAEASWSLADYKEHFDQILGLKDMITNPFVLSMVVYELPKIVAKHQTDHPDKKLELTTGDVYQSFAHSWFVRQREKVIRYGLDVGELDPTELVEFFYMFCKKLASLMRLHGVVKLTYAAKGSFDAEEDRKPWDHLFANSKEMILGRMGAPIVREGDEYRFLHDSLIDYFAVRECGVHITGAGILEEKGSKIGGFFESNDQNGSLLHAKNLRSHFKMIEFFAEEVQKHPELKEKYFDMVMRSKTDPAFTHASSNAMMILNWARVSFSGMDLEGIQAPNANLNGAIFYNTNLKGVNFKETSLGKSYIVGANLERADLQDVEFNEKKHFEFEDGSQLVAINADGKVVAAGSGSFGTLKVWDVETGENWKNGGQGDIERIHISANGKTVAATSSRKVEISNMERRFFHGLEKAFVLGFDVDDRVVFVENHKTLKIWNINEQGHLQWKFSNKIIGGSPDGKIIVTMPAKHIFRIWDMSQGKHLDFKEIGDIKLMRVSGNGKTIAAVIVTRQTDMLKAWSTDTGESLGLDAYSGSIKDLAISSEGKIIVTGDANGLVRIWNVETGSYWGVRHASSILSVGISADGKTIVTGTYDKKLRIWDAERINIGKEKKYKDNLTAFDTSIDGKTIVAGGGDGRVWIWNADTGDMRELKYRYLIGAHADYISVIGISGDGKTVVSGSVDDHKVLIWDVEKEMVQAVPSAQWAKEQPDYLGVSTDGTRFIICNMGVIAICNTENGDVVDYLGDIGNLREMKVSRDGNMLVIRKDEGQLKIWDIEKKKSQELKGGASEPVMVGISGNGKIIFTYNRGDSIWIWDLMTEENWEFKGKIGSPSIMSMSPDGKILVVGNKDGEVQIWIIQTEKCVYQFYTPFPVTDVKYLASGDVIVIASVLYRFRCINKDAFEYSLDWVDECIFACNKANFTNAQLSADNKEMLKQRGALV